jgi:hypothetical protein
MLRKEGLMPHWVVRESVVEALVEFEPYKQGRLEKIAGETSVSSVVYLLGKVKTWIEGF